MRNKIGSICILAGIVFLLNPNYQLNSYVMWFETAFRKYWPLLLILFGMSLQTKSEKRKRKSR